MGRSWNFFLEKRLTRFVFQVSVPIVSNDRCKSMFLRAGRHEFIPDIFLCAGYESGGQDSCQVYFFVFYLFLHLVIFQKRETIRISSNKRRRASFRRLLSVYHRATRVVLFK